MNRWVLSLLLSLSCSLYAVSLQTLQKQCLAKVPVACHDLGVLYDLKSDLSRAATHYRQACDLKHAPGCYKLAELYLLGSGVAQSDTKFQKLMQRACRLGYQKGCSALRKPSTLSVVPAAPKQRAHRSSTATALPSVHITRKDIGTIDAAVSLADQKQRIIEIDAVMRNDFAEADGWFSFSFPQLHSDHSVTLTTKGFTRINAYPQGYSIYSIAKHKAIPGRYLLIEAEARSWQKGHNKTVHIRIKVPESVKRLKIDIRGTLKQGKKLVSFPEKGSIGQQGFANYRIEVPIGIGRRSTSGMHLQLGTTRATEQPQEEIQLTRRQKLLLLDQLFDLSYYHRQRKAFEAQLRQTLFGGTHYLSWIKEYRCTPLRGTGKSRCRLRLGGQGVKSDRSVSWEFDVQFSAEKTAEGVKITEIHSLDLLE